MKKIICLIFILVVSCNSGSLQNILNRNDAFFRYSLVKKTKPFFKNDTIIDIYNIYLEKNKNDSLYNLNFKINTEKYKIYHYDNKTYTFDLVNKNYFINNKVKTYIKKILIPNNINRIILDTTNFEKIINNETDTEYIIRKKIKNSQGFTNIYKTYFISKQQKQISKIITSIDFQFSNQYDELIYSNFDYSIKLKLKNEIDSLLSIFSKQKKNKKDHKIKHIKMPNFSGVLVNKNETIQLYSYQSNLIILDYWHMSCYPCIKSFPFLNKLKKKYPDDKLQIIGVNIIDTNNSILKQFIKSNNIEYQTILTKENPLNINEFPTFILINEKKKIIYSHSGINQVKENEIIKIINKKLNK